MMQGFFSGRCAADDCISTYSVLVSEGRLLFRVGFWRVSAQRAAWAWSLETTACMCVCVCVCVCVARQSVWVHRKPIETPAGYHCQPLIKREKECIGPRANMAALKRAGWFGRTVFSSFLFSSLTPATFTAW